MNSLNNLVLAFPFILFFLQFMNLQIMVMQFDTIQDLTYNVSKNLCFQGLRTCKVSSGPRMAGSLLEELV
jgi:hypothetical protein